MTQDNSPKLKTAMAEIKSIVDRYDIAAQVILHEPGYSEYLLKVDPSWSALKLEERDGNTALRFRARAIDYEGDLKRRDQVVSDSCNLVVHFRDVADQNAQIFQGVLEMVREDLEIIEGKKVFTPHRWPSRDL